MIASQIAIALPASAASTVDQQQTQTTDAFNPGGAFTGAAANQITAQTFVAGASGTLDQVSLHMHLQNSPAPGDLVVQIRTVDGSGLPTNDVLGGGTLPGGSFVPFDTRWVDIPLTQPAQVGAGNTYAIAVSSTEPYGPDSGIYYLSLVTVGDVYPQGRLIEQPGGGSFSLAPPEWDLAFKTWVTSAADEGPSTPALVNAGFEAGTLGGWTSGGSGVPFVTTSYSGLTAPNGVYFAAVPAGACEPTTLHQSFTAGPGDTLSGWAFFKTHDYLPYSDNGAVKILLESGSTVIDTLFSSSISAVGSYGQTPWTPWSHTFTASGTYTIEVRTANGGDCGVDSIVGLDMASADASPPSVAVSHVANGANGWNLTSPVALSIVVADESALAGSPACKANGVDLPVLGAASPYSASVSGSGIHQVECSASDVYGNAGMGTDTVSVDDVAPSITKGASSGGAAYLSAVWTSADVEVGFSCTDAISGVASLSGDTTVSSEGSGQSVTGTCTDQAGNVALSTFDNIQIDKSLPTISASATSGGMPYGSGTWTNDAVVVGYDCTDAPSGVASLTGPQTVDAEGGGQSRTGTCVDNAGNSASATFAGIQIDTTPPSLSGAPSAQPNGNGWYSDEVSVAWSCSDALSGVAGECPADSRISTEGTGLSATASVYDQAGNAAQATVDGVDIDRTPPTIALVDRSPAPNGAGWNRSPVTLTFVCSDGLSGIGSCPETRTIENEGAGSAVTATATDQAGNEQSLTVDDVDIDMTAPTLEGHPTTEPNGNGWYNADVTIAWQASDAPSGIAGSALPGDSTITGEGAALTATASVSDRAGNETGASSPPVSIDRTAPMTTATAPDWTNDAAVIDLDAGDNLSGVERTTYSVDGGEPQTGSTVTIADEGIHTLSFFSADRAGNVEDTRTIEVKIDKTAPSIAPHIEPAPNARGWNMDDVTVSFVCGDSASGIASCTGPTTLTDEGRDQTVEGTATDNAGNSATASAGVSIDETAPEIEAAPDRASNARGWYNAPVEIAFACSDALSGIQSCPATATLSSEGPDQSAGGTARDAAGNEATASAWGINIDMTAPRLSGVATSDPNGAGWYSGDVTVSWSCADDLSGVAGGCPADTVIDGEGEGLSATTSVVDRAGNVTTATVGGIKIDRTAPVVAYSGNAQTYTIDQQVAISCSAFDALSGIASKSCDGVSGDAYSFGIGTHTLSAGATDLAGNSGAASTTFRVVATYDSLIALTKRFVSDNGVAGGLCAKLEAARQADARGNEKAEAGMLSAYRSELQAQSGKRLTTERATFLSDASTTL